MINAEDSRVSILLVDDRPDKLLALETALSSLKQRIVKVQSGADALRAMLRQEFAVIVLDVNMPGMDGFETASFIRQRPSTQSTPIIFVTSINTTDTHVSRGYRLGAVDYIFTPVEPEALRAKVSVFIDLYRKTEQVKKQSEWLRNEAERRAAHVETRMRGLLNRLNVGVYRARKDGAIIEANPAFLRLLGIGAVEEVRHLNMSALMECHRSLLESGRQIEGRDIELQRSDGTTLWTSCSHALAEDAGEEFIDGLIEDVSERKLAEAALRESEGKYRSLTQELREADTRKDEFLAMLGHELRNPLNAINSAVQLLRRPGKETPLPWCHEVIERQTRALAHIVDDLLDVSRITRGKIQLQREVMDLRPAIESAIGSCRPLMEQKRHHVEVRFPEEEILIQADRTRIEQIVVNLLTNAGKYTRPEGQIRICARKDGSFADLVVEDNGIGIPRQILPRVFDAFMQADHTLDRSQGGLGIGLTLVQKLTELHGGTVCVRSEGPNQGSRFTVRFPLCRQPATRPTASPQVPSQETSPSKVPPETRILVVEDNLDTAEALSRYLTTSGLKVRTARDGQSAVQAALEFRPEVVLLDIGLPGADGYEVARRLRAEEGFRHILIIGISGYGQQRDKLRSSEAGFDDHFVKPLNYEKLMETLTRHLSRQQHLLHLEPLGSFEIVE